MEGRSACCWTDVDYFSWPCLPGLHYPVCFHPCVGPVPFSSLPRRSRIRGVFAIGLSVWQPAPYATKTIGVGLTRLCRHPRRRSIHASFSVSCCLLGSRARVLHCYVSRSARRDAVAAGHPPPCSLANVFLGLRQRLYLPVVLDCAPARLAPRSSRSVCW